MFRKVLESSQKTICEVLRQQSCWPPDASCKKVFLDRYSQNSQEKACVRDSILIKLHSQDCKKRLWHKCFPVNLAKFLRKRFLQNTSGRLLLFLAFQKQSPEVFHEERVPLVCEISKVLFLQNTSGRMLLAFSCNVTKMVVLPTVQEKKN